MVNKKAGVDWATRPSRNWPVLLIGFGGLLVLLGLFASTTFQQAQKIYGEMSAIHEGFRKNNELMNEIQINIYLSGLLVRDYLLDPSISSAVSTRQDLKQVHDLMSAGVDELGHRLGQEDARAIDQFRLELNAFMESLEPIYDWTPTDKLVQSRSFLRQYVLPRRQRALSLAKEVAELNTLNFQRQELQLRQRQDAFGKSLVRMMVATMFLGLLVAAVSIFQIIRLERRAAQQHYRTEMAEQELRQLSNRLVNAQEEERKAISRDLHDQVGQILTGLRMELGNLDQLRSGPEEQFHKSLGEIKQLTEQTLRVVRDMSMGLRPSMLDDLGLGPALEWLARDLSRRSGLIITTEIDGVLDHFPESHRTCVYRVVQETLTNCVRHARAKQVRIALHGSPTWVSVIIQDDGVGMDTDNPPHSGIGLIGIEERVRELGGSVNFDSQVGKGTLIRVEIPLIQEEKL
jgi:signal transduction histidine kinase